MELEEHIIYHQNLIKKIMNGMQLNSMENIIYVKLLGVQERLRIINSLNHIILFIFVVLRKYL